MNIGDTLDLGGGEGGGVILALSFLALNALVSMLGPRLLCHCIPAEEI